MADPEIGTSPLNAERSIVASSPGDESHIVGRDDFADKLVSLLIDKLGDRANPRVASLLIDKRGDHANLRVISVVGEGAIGKTALVRSVYNRADIKNHFDRCAWVRVGPKPNLVYLMVDLLKHLRPLKLRDVDLMDEKELSNELLRVLMTCRYLIVLDDLCELHVMDELMMVLADSRNGESRNGSRVIVTTRDPDIPSSIDPWYFKPLKLSPLDGEQSEKLLKTCSPAFRAVDQPVELLHLKERILSKSGGSPLKILLLGGLISDTTSDRCTEIAHQLTDGLPNHPTLQEVVRLSVDHLPEGLKQCALYLSMFPKESEIPTRRLFRLWSAECTEKLIFPATENGAVKCIKILVSRHMVEVARHKWDGSARSCRLPRSLYDVFYQMAENERFLKIYDRSIHDKKKFDAPRIAKHRDISGWGGAKAQINVPEAGRERSETNAQEAHMEITPASDSSPSCGIQQLLSYVSFNTMKLGTRAGETAVLLKLLVPKRPLSLLGVLDLEGVYKPSLPEELGNIVPTLKYLGLRWTLLEWLPKSVAQLSCLETLDLKYTNISSLPESILEAKNLQHLYMPEVNLDCSTYQLFPRKSLNCNIQTLWGLVIDDGSLMFGVLSKLTGLRKLALTCKVPVVSKATKHILNLEMLKCLRLRSEKPFESTDETYEMSDMSRLKCLSNLYLLGTLGVRSLLESNIPPNLKVLTLSNSTLYEDPMGVLGLLKCLTTLRLFANSYCGNTLSVLEETFPSLRVLKLQKMYFLRTIQANAMPCLEDLEMNDCENLTVINRLKEIKTLKLITLDRVPDTLVQCVKDMQLDVPFIVKKWPEEQLNKEDDEEDYEEDDEDNYSE